jgi:hypothetical protein
MVSWSTESCVDARVFTVKTVGIYLIIGPDGRYVGQSTYIEKRWDSHRYNLRRGKHHIPRLQSAWSSEASNVRFTIALICKSEDLDFYEQLILDQVWSCGDCYNVSRCAISAKGLRGPRANNWARRGEEHASWGKPRPDLAALNRSRAGMPVPKRKPYPSGEAHGLFGFKRPFRNRPEITGRLKLLPQADAIKARLLAGESIASISRDLRVKQETMSRLKRLLIERDGNFLEGVKMIRRPRFLTGGILKKC